MVFLSLDLKPIKLIIYKIVSSNPYINLCESTKKKAAAKSIAEEEVVAILVKEDSSINEGKHWLHQ